MTKEQQNALISICTGAAILIVALIKFIPLFNGGDDINSKVDVSSNESYSSSLENGKTKMPQLEIPNMPFEVSYLTYSKKISSTYKITDIKYETKNVLGTYITYIDVSGTKIYDIEGNENNTSAHLSWKIYDINDSSLVVDSGHLFLPDLCVGEKFEKVSTNTSKLQKGKKYKLVFYNE